MLERSRSRHATTVSIAVFVAALVAGAWSAAAAGNTSGKTQARKYLLVLSDMPHGWKVEKGGGGGGANGAVPGAKQLASCVGVSPSLIGTNPPEVDSPYFENSAGSLEAQDSVSIFSSAKTARAQLSAMANAKTPGCMTTLMNGPLKSKIAGSAGSGATVGTISVTRLNTAGFPQGTTGLFITVPVSEGGQSLTVNLALVYFVKGKFGQTLSFNAYGTSFPSSTAQSLTNVARDRL